MCLYDLVVVMFIWGVVNIDKISYWIWIVEYVSRDMFVNIVYVEYDFLC